MPKGSDRGEDQLRTQVCIIGGGPSGLLLAQLLHAAGIDTIVLEHRPRDHVLSRVRAGVLEWGSVETLTEAGVGARLMSDGAPHDGIGIATENRGFRVDLAGATGKRVMVYGQTELTRDLYEASDGAGLRIVDRAEGVTPTGLETATPCVTYTRGGAEHRIDCEFIAGCDGFHGVSRQSIPGTVLSQYERAYPFGWLGLLSETPPATGEILYAGHERGFALCSMRNPSLSRYYIQVPADTRAGDWTDAAFWDELRRRLPADIAETLVTGPAIEKSVAPLRSYVGEPMRWGRLFLAGDAAHIVPPTGAKGLNLAVGDVRYLSDALIRHYGGDDSGIETYSDRALARVWKAMRFAWWFTTLMHRFPDHSGYDRRMQTSELDLLEASAAQQAALAEQYVGLPY